MQWEHHLEYKEYKDFYFQVKKKQKNTILF